MVGKRNLQSKNRKDINISKEKKMSNTPFLSPRLIGKRFENGAIPLEFLKDLAVLSEMITEIAKNEFLKDNPTRKRTPKGFTEGIEFQITSIEKGSAIPQICLNYSDNSLFPPTIKDYLDRARDSVINAIDAAKQNNKIDNFLPEKMFNYFDRFGRSLLDDEEIEFNLPSNGKTTTLTKETRRKILLASPKVNKLTEETFIRGTIPEVDQDNMTFQIQFEDKKITAPLTEQHLDIILEATNKYKNGIRVSLKGIGIYNRSNKLLSFDNVEHVTLLDSLDIPARIEEFKKLKDGWNEGFGKAPSHENLNWISQSFENYYLDELPLPFLYPTPEGNIQAEWTLDNVEITLEINLTTHEAFWHSLNMNTDEEKEIEFILDDLNDWKRLSDAIGSILSIQND